MLEGLFDLPLAPNDSPIEAREYYEHHFARIAAAMFQHDLVIAPKDKKQEKRYALLEIEAYLQAPNHPDPYCHDHPLQQVAGSWFFHHVGHSAGFRGGSRQGVDITIGSKTRKSAGGMLIRAMRDKDTHRLIEGPSLLVDEILKVLGHKNIKSLVETIWQQDHANCWDPDAGFYLDPAPKPPQKMHTSCRVGLGLKNQQPSLENRLLFVGRPYRFVEKPWLLKKGRMWTIFGMLDHLSPHEITSLTNASEANVTKLKAEYDRGQSEPIETLKKCLTSQDIMAGGAGWKIRVMSAIRWWECEHHSGKTIPLLEDINKRHKP